MNWLIGIVAGVGVLIVLGGLAGVVLAPEPQFECRSGARNVQGKTLAELRYDSHVLRNKGLTLVRKIQTVTAPQNGTDAIEVAKRRHIARRTAKDDGRVLTERTGFFDGL